MRKTFQFLYLGNLIPSKGIFLILHACRILVERGNDFLCLFVGSGTKELSVKGLQEKIVRMELDAKCMICGAKYGEEKERIFQMSDAFLFPTTYHNECFPLVLLEAMQHSLPIIATPVGAIPDIVQQGKNGLIIPENDALALAQAMQELMASPDQAKEMGQCGSAIYKAKYTKQSFETTLAGILQNIS